AGAAYAFVHGRWQTCISEHYACFRGRSEREIKVATAELRRRTQRSGQAITSRKLADFLKAAETEELLWLQQRRDREARQSLGHVTDNWSAGVMRPARVTVPTPDDGPLSDRHLDEEDNEPLPLFEDV